MKKILSTKNIFLFLILYLGFLLRFFNFPHQYIFDPDAVRDAIVSLEAARGHYFPLAGAFSSTGPYTFGPWYYIGLILAQTIIPTLYTPWILMGLASLVTIFLMYKLGELLGSKTLGLILALLTSISPSEIIAGTGLSNIFPVPLFTAAALVITAKIVKTKRIHLAWYTLLGICLGLAINAHYQSSGLLFLPLLLWFYKGWKKYQIPFFILSGIALTFIPLLLFNLKMDWHTFHGVQEMYLSRGRIYVANSWKIYLLQFWPGLLGFYLGTPRIANIIILLALFLFLCLQMYKRKLFPPALSLFAGALLINFISLRFYWGERSFGYHYFLEPIIILFTGYMLYFLRRIPYGSILFGIFLAIICVSSLSANIQKLFPSNTLNDYVNKELLFLKQRYPDQRIIIYACNVSPDNQAQSLAYLLSFEQMPNTPSKKIAVINTQCSIPFHPQRKFIYVTKSTVLTPLPGTSLMDFSAFSDSAIKQASWSAVSTNEIFTKTVKWY